MKPKGPPPRVLRLFATVMIAAGGLSFVALEVLLRTVWNELPWWDVRAISAAVGAIPAWLLTGACFRQKHTYNAKIYEKNWGCLIPTWLFFFSMMTLLMGIFFGAPAAFFAYGLIRAVDGTAWYYAPVMLASGLFALPISVSALSRGLLVWATRRHVEELATSTARAAAPGLVELRGTARSLEGKDGLIFGQMPELTVPARPFILEDATGRIRVEPPAGDSWGEPNFSLKLHPTYGLHMLEAGDPVLVVGVIREDPARPGERILAPWTSTGASFGTRLLSRPEIFLLCGGDEEGAKRRLARVRMGWLALGVALTCGSLVVVGVAAAAWAGFAPLSSLRLARP